MNQLANDPEAVALSKIYSLLIKKANEKKQQAKKEVVEGTTTIQGLGSHPLPQTKE